MYNIHFKCYCFIANDEIPLKRDKAFQTGKKYSRVKDLTENYTIYHQTK